MSTWTDCRKCGAQYDLAGPSHRCRQADLRGAEIAELKAEVKQLLSLLEDCEVWIDYNVPADTRGAIDAREDEKRSELLSRIRALKEST